jgi:hypothetical protein
MMTGYIIDYYLAYVCFLGHGSPPSHAPMLQVDSDVDSRDIMVWLLAGPSQSQAAPISWVQGRSPRSPTVRPGPTRRDRGGGPQPAAASHGGPTDHYAALVRNLDVSS